MTAVKICGINDEAGLKAAAEGGARYIGFVFYPPSPRFIDGHRAAELIRQVPSRVKVVGLFVNPDPDYLETITSQVVLDMIQFHGDEGPEYCNYARQVIGLPVMKAIPVAGPEDLMQAGLYADVADWLLFDARPPDNVTALPGGNALSFDWSLLAGIEFPLPWMLAGGLNAGNVREAVRISGAMTVDVSSGVEDRPGHKDPRLIRDFIARARRL